MGLLGLFSIGMAVARQVAYDVDERKTNDLAKKRPTEYGTYRDAHGVERRLDNNNIICRETWTGDTILRDDKAGIRVNTTIYKLMKNWDEEAAKAKGFGKSVVKYGNDTHSFDSVKGQRYIDIDTQKLYVLREINGDFGNGWDGKNFFFVDANTEKIVRKSDGQKVKDATAKNMIEKYPSHMSEWKIEYSYYMDEAKTAEFIRKYNSDSAFRSQYRSYNREMDW